MPTLYFLAPILLNSLIFIYKIYHGAPKMCLKNFWRAKPLIYMSVWEALKGASTPDP